MKILCFGDSNTYGYDPRSYFGGQYDPAYRWVDLLAGKLGCTAVNAGEVGREIPVRETERLRFARLLRDQKPDLLIIMLGTNDLLQGHSPEAAALRMEDFLTRIDWDPGKILLIAPPPMKLGFWVPTQELADASKELGAAYQALSGRLGIRFADAGAWQIALTFDGVHLAPEGHAAFAENLFRCI